MEGVRDLGGGGNWPGVLDFSLVGVLARAPTGVACAGEGLARLRLGPRRRDGGGVRDAVLCGLLSLGDCVGCAASSGCFAVHMALIERFTSVLAGWMIFHSNREISRIIQMSQSQFEFFT